MDNKINVNDSPVEFRSQQFRDQRPPTGPTPGPGPGQRPPTGPTPGPGPGQRPPTGPTPGPGPGQRPPTGPTPGPGPGQRPPTRPTPGPGPGQRPPTRPTPGPGPGQRPPTGPTPPGMGQQPRSAPPDFIPQGPFTERGAGRQQGQYRERFRGDMRTRPRDFYGCLNSFTYLWLVNGNNFWFFPIFIDRQFVIGFRWRRNRWEFDRINLNRIFFFSCF